MSKLDLQKTKEIVVVQPLINEIMNDKKKVDHEKIRDLLDLFRELKKENLGSNNIKKIITKNIQGLRKKQADLGEEIVMTAEQGKKLALVGGRKKTKKRKRRVSRVGRKKRKTRRKRRSRRKRKTRKIKGGITRVEFNLQRFKAERFQEMLNKCREREKELQVREKELQVALASSSTGKQLPEELEKNITSFMEGGRRKTRRKKGARRPERSTTRVYPHPTENENITYIEPNRRGRETLWREHKVNIRDLPRARVVRTRELPLAQEVVVGKVRETPRQHLISLAKKCKNKFDSACRTVKRMTRRALSGSGRRNKNTRRKRKPRRKIKKRHSKNK